MMKKRSFCSFLCFLLMLCCAMMPACRSAGKSSKETSESDRSTESMSIDFTTNEETEVPTPSTPSEPKEFQLRVGSYNIKHDELAGLDMTKIANNITSLELDGVGLQEIDQMTTRVNGVDTMKALSEATGYPYYHFFKAMTYQGGQYGLGILSKYPIVNTERILLHKNSSVEQRVLGRAEIDVDGTTFQFFVTHLEHKNEYVRGEQFKNIAETLKSYDNFVVTGDFNTLDFNAYAVIENAAMVNNSEKNLATTPSGYSIDNIVYAASSWSFSEPMALEQSYSDHYLLYADATFIP